MVISASSDHGELPKAPRRHAPGGAHTAHYVVWEHTGRLAAEPRYKQVGRTAQNPAYIKVCLYRGRILAINVVCVAESRNFFLLAYAYIEYACIEVLLY
jgi:hypothetical protein